MGSLEKCSLLSNEKFESLAKSDDQWFCSKCINECLPFNSLSYNVGINITSDDIVIVSPESITPFLDQCNSAANNFYDNFHSQDLSEFPNPINSKYYDITQFNSIKHDPTSSFCLYH